MAQSRAQNAKTEKEARPGVVKLSDLAIEGRKFELEGKTYTTKSPITLTLPDIAKIDGMGKQINKYLPSFGKGEYENIDMDAFQQLLIDMVVNTSDVPEEVAKKAHWWQQLLIIGLFQSTAGMDFLSEQLPQLGGIPKELQAELTQTLKGEKTAIPTSPTP